MAFVAGCNAARFETLHVASETLLPERLIGFVAEIAAFLPVLGGRVGAILGIELNNASVQSSHRQSFHRLRSLNPLDARIRELIGELINISSKKLDSCSSTPLDHQASTWAIRESGN